MFDSLSVPGLTDEMIQKFLDAVEDEMSDAFDAGAHHMARELLKRRQSASPSLDVLREARAKLRKALRYSGFNSWTLREDDRYTFDLVQASKKILAATDAPLSIPVVDPGEWKSDLPSAVGWWWKRDLVLSNGYSATLVYIVRKGKSLYDSSWSPPIHTLTQQYGPSSRMKALWWHPGPIEMPPLPPVKRSDAQ